MSRPEEDPNIRPGDIIVRAVPGGTHRIERVQRDGQHAHVLGFQVNRDSAMMEACKFAGQEHRVFVFPDASSDTYNTVKCP